MKVVVTFVPKEEEVEMKKMVLELDLSMPASKVRIQFPSFTIFFRVEKLSGKELVSVSMIFMRLLFCRWKSCWAGVLVLSLVLFDCTSVSQPG